MGNALNTGVQSLFTKRSATVDTGWLSSWFPSGGGALTAAGKKINQSTSLKISAFYCAVTTIAESFAILPKSVYQKKDGKQNRVETHSLDYILHDEANEQMTAFVFSFIMVLSVFMKGNAYALILRDNAGNIVGLKYLDHDNVTVLEHQGKLYYKYKQATYLANEILHIPGYSSNGITGQSIIQHAADSLGIPYAAQQFGAASYNEKGLGLGVLETESSLKPDAKKAIKDAWNSTLAGNDPYRAVVLDEGFSYKPIRLSPEASKFIEAKVEGVADIARWFKMPLHMLHVKGEGGYNFLLQMSISYLQHAIQPIAEKFKQEYKRKLLTPAERKSGMYIYFNYGKLLQVDPKARGEFYKTLGMLKAITSNEIREKEDMNPLDGGDEPLQMVNMQTDSQMNKKLQDA